MQVVAWRATEMTAASTFRSSGFGTVRSVIDDQDHSGHIAHTFGIVRNGCIANQVVTRSELNRVSALRETKMSGQNDEMLIAPVCMKAGPLTRAVARNDDANVAWDGAVDLLHYDASRTNPVLSIGSSNDARWWIRVEKKPGNRDADRHSKSGQRLERGRSLLVFDLAQVSDIQPAAFGHLAEREPSFQPPVPDFPSHGRPSAPRRPWSSCRPILSRARRRRDLSLSHLSWILPRQRPNRGIHFVEVGKKRSECRPAELQRNARRHPTAGPSQRTAV